LSIYHFLFEVAKMLTHRFPDSPAAAARLRARPARRRHGELSQGSWIAHFVKQNYVIEAAVKGWVEVLFERAQAQAT
jgi:hypothetical protein